MLNSYSPVAPFLPPTQTKYSCPGLDWKPTKARPQPEVKLNPEQPTLTIVSIVDPHVEAVILFLSPTKQYQLPFSCCDRKSLHGPRFDTEDASTFPLTISALIANRTLPAGPFPLQGINEGWLEGLRNGVLEGCWDGFLDGVEEGILEGFWDGLLDGVLEGLPVVGRGDGRGLDGFLPSLPLPGLLIALLGCIIRSLFVALSVIVSSTRIIVVDSSCVLLAKTSMGCRKTTIATAILLHEIGRNFILMSDPDNS